jgi:tungstate transport system substrate-binding protein
MRRKRWFTVRVLLGLVALTFAACDGGDSELILATTTSTENSGLLDVLITLYEEESGDSVKVIAVGSGAAMSIGKRGDADVLLVHSPAAEQAFVDAGFGMDRARVMFNDFIIVGPVEDPAGIVGMSDAAAAFTVIQTHGEKFISRGDDSGTHVKEKALWAAAGLEVPADARWYMESGQGMAATLTIATETGAYTLTDRATWLSVADPERLPLLVEDDERLFNIYHVIVVSPNRHNAVNDSAARRFRAFLLEPTTQQLIGEFGAEQYGQPLFTTYSSELD